MRSSSFRESLRSVVDLIGKLLVAGALLLVAGVLLAPLCLALIETWRWLSPAFPVDVLPVRDILHGAAEEGKTAYKTSKNILELLNFLSGPLLWLTAVVAFAITFRQLSEARKQRLSEVLIGVSKDWDNLEPHRQTIRGYYEGRAGDTRVEAGLLILKILLKQEPAIPGSDLQDVVNDYHVENLKQSVDTVLSYLEDVGHLCRKRYLRKADVCDIIGNSIEQSIEILLPPIREERKSDGGDAVYANALWLYEGSLKFRLFRISGYGHE